MNLFLLKRHGLAIRIACMMQTMNNLILAIAVAASTLTACTTFDWPFSRSSRHSISIQADVDANQDNATAIDIVLVYDQTALSLLPKTGPEWFAKKAALLLSLKH